ncbi:hypothetical protein ABIF38_007799 [Bradyrhizobium japonicum]|jgi:hypothetical protein|uniref:Uncharacterized protein n=1 Tax=Bradyrhizobium elkanii TaxID=29448 RepID=A0A8I1YES9_BRAEL|nr:hypothetical protein [Bradyrhizobium elkanii]MCS4006331.1 hypothetical protein [Bradyrhizobium elkanii USDA 61]MBP2427888.1 hypothetical protein [Bradyrhizobium elkanii]MCP1729886.1 hypothetical protein [Bradyrhizobium elkanii]MCP1756627.1 hypothetical protein [Bradyrhizobium elkanii]
MIVNRSLFDHQSPTFDGHADDRRKKRRLNLGWGGAFA